jgi:RHS repeat-associated protein
MRVDGLRVLPNLLTHRDSLRSGDSPCRFSRTITPLTSWTHCSRSLRFGHRRSWSSGSTRSCTTNHSRGCSINRYYDPTTDQFLTVDPALAQTNQPYVFVNDNPINATDPLGLCFICNLFSSAVHVVSHVAKAVVKYYAPVSIIVSVAKFVVHHPLATAMIVAGAAIVVGSAGLGAAIAPMLAADIVGADATLFSVSTTLAHGAIILAVPAVSGAAGVASVYVGVKIAVTSKSKTKVRKR